MAVLAKICKIPLSTYKNSFFKKCKLNQRKEVGSFAKIPLFFFKCKHFFIL